MTHKVYFSFRYSSNANQFGLQCEDRSHVNYCRFLSCLLVSKSFLLKKRDTHDKNNNIFIHFHFHREVFKAHKCSTQKVLDFMKNVLSIDDTLTDVSKSIYTQCESLIFN